MSFSVAVVRKAIMCIGVVGSAGSLLVSRVGLAEVTG